MLEHQSGRDREVVGDEFALHVWFGDGLVDRARAEALEPYIIDDGVGTGLSPAVECGMVVSLDGNLAGVLHHLFHVIELGTVNLHVEVAGHNHRKTFWIDAVDPVDDEFHAILTCLPADMIEVGVDIVILLAAGLVLKESPSRGAEASGVPTHRRLLGSL